MNFLLFVYHTEDMKTPDETIANIGVELSKIMSSNQIKYMFGDRHSIYHFASDFSADEIDDFLCLVSAEFENFNYFLTQKTKTIRSNFDEDNLLHLLTLRNTNKKKQTPPKKFEFEMDLGGGEDFARMADTIMGLIPKKRCELTMDELLDKIGSEGINSLTEEEKSKLDEYSKNY
jgi:RNA binding exosome subunit